MCVSLQNTATILKLLSLRRCTQDVNTHPTVNFNSFTLLALPEKGRINNGSTARRLIVCVAVESFAAAHIKRAV